MYQEVILTTTSTRTTAACGTVRRPGASRQPDLRGRGDAAGGTGGDGEHVTDVSYDGQGCSISQAATSVLADQ